MAKKEPIEVYFLNVDITVSDVQSAEEAYDKLMKVFEAAGIEYHTTTFATSDAPTTERETMELFPHYRKHSRSGNE